MFKLIVGIFLYTLGNFSLDLSLEELILCEGIGMLIFEDVLK